MKRLALLLALLMAVTAQAPLAYAQVLWGLKGGVVVSDIRWEEGEAETDTLIDPSNTA